MKKLFVILAAMFLFLSTSCGSGGDGGGSSNNNPSPTPSSNLSGTWYGSYNSTVDGAQTMEVDLQQNNSTLSGTFISSTGSIGTVSGSVNSGTASFSVTIINPGCDGSFNATGIVNTQTNPYSMSIQYSGSTACDGNESGTGNLEKQTATTANTTGTWKGDFALIGTVTLEIQQNGSVVTGTFSSASDGASGTLTGSASGNAGTAVMHVTSPPACAGDLDVPLIVVNTLISPEIMVFQYNGSLACTGSGTISGSGLLEKQ